MAMAAGAINLNQIKFQILSAFGLECIWVSGPISVGFVCNFGTVNELLISKIGFYFSWACNENI